MGGHSNSWTLVARSRSLSELAERTAAAVRMSLGDARWRADALLDRVDAVRDRADELRERASDLRARADGMLGRADAALDRLDRAIADLRRTGRVRWRARVRTGGSSRAPRDGRPMPRRDRASVPTGAGPVSTVMREVAAIVEADDPISDAAKHLVGAPDAHVVAVEDERVVGVVTSRHVIAAVADRRDPTTAAIADVMAPTMVTIPPTATLEEAAVLVKYLHAEELVVVEGGRAVGVVAASDLPVRP